MPGKSIIYTALLALIAFSGCVKPQMDYIGRSYPRTVSVDLFLDQKEIKKEFEVMGKLIVSTKSPVVSTEEMQEKIMEKAREKGADAVLIESFGVYTAQGTTTTNTSVSKDAKGNPQATTSTETQSSDIKQITAQFLKYKS